MENLIRHWYEFMVYIAGCYALILGLTQWSATQTTLLLGLIIIHLHFFEEFGFPGGFAWGGIKVEMHHVPTDVAKWPLNQLSSLWGNVWFAGMVYLLPLFKINWHWLILAAMVFSYLELIMHWGVFNIGLHSWYNPGSFTALLLIIPATNFLAKFGLSGLFSPLDVGLAILWILVNYWLAFRSPIFNWFNHQENYRFSKADLAKSQPYMKKFGITVTDFKNWR